MDKVTDSGKLRNKGTALSRTKNIRPDSALDAEIEKNMFAFKREAKKGLLILGGELNKYETDFFNVVDRKKNALFRKDVYSGMVIITVLLILNICIGLLR